MGILNKIRKRYDDRALKRQVTHIHGPQKFTLRDDEVALVILGRNVSYHLKTVVEHHRALGADYLMYMDNGSTDDSIEIAKSFPNTIVATCPLQFREYQMNMRHYASTLFIDGGWRLVLDSDELLHYPGCDHLALPDLTQRISAEGHTAMVCQMLEMVPPGPLSAHQGLSFPETIRQFNSYSLADIDARDYYSQETRWRWFLEQNKISNPDIKVMFGGIRATLFGEECCMTKHPLFKMGPEIDPGAHPHVSTGLSCTDFSGVLKHYKFSGDFLDREKERIAAQRLKHNEAVLRLSRFADEPDLSFKLPTSQFDPTVEGLLEDGFLVASDAAKIRLGL
ncbi:MAG: glycosyltransferase family 2 protein [Pseudomonadota bacterium]